MLSSYIYRPTDLCKSLFHACGCTLGVQGEQCFGMPTHKIYSMKPFFHAKQQLT